MSDPNPMHVFAEDYLQRGWSIVPIPPVNGRPTKAPTTKGWPDKLLKPGSATAVLQANWNVGLLLQALADVDLDCLEAREAGLVFLPSTGLVYGRASSPKSHWLYQLQSPLPYKKIILPGDQERGDLLELRTMQPVNGSKPKALQSLLPPSIHPDSGETYDWACFEEAASTEADVLWRAVHLVAITAALAKLHPPFGAMHNASRDVYRLTIAGTLARKLPEETAWLIFDTALGIAGDKEDRTTIFKDTLKRLRSDQPVKGIPAFIEFVGKKPARAILSWISEISGEKHNEPSTTHAEAHPSGEENERGPEQSTSQPATTQAAGRDFGSERFEVSEKGVYYVPAAEDGEPKPPIWICSTLAVVAMTRDAKSSKWGRMLTWKDNDGVDHEWAMPCELLQRDGGAEVRVELASQGLLIAPGPKASGLLSTYLQFWPVDKRARCVERLGWHGPVYILPSATVGNADERVVFQNAHAIEPAFSGAGTTEEWRNEVASLAQGNSRMVFAICTAFAGPLLEPAKENSGGFHLRGPSSTGKTTALHLAASVWGQYEEYCRSWLATANGLEGVAALHNDGLLVLDELGQIDPREVGKAAYLLANGRGKSRAARSGAARQVATWRLLFLSSGEHSLASLMSQAGEKATAGQEIRLAEIDADAGASMGAIEQLHGRQSSAELALDLQGAASKYYGRVGSEWLAHLVEDRGKLPPFLVEGIQQFVKEFVPKEASEQIERVARRFGLVAIAGEIATRYGLTGWAEHEAVNAVAKCFLSWQELFGCGSREERTLLAQARAFFESHGNSRFQDINAVENKLIINRAGFYRTDGNRERELLVFPEVFKREICSGWDPRSAAKVFVRYGWLTPGSDKAAQRVRLPCLGPTRMYVFGQKCWEGDE